MSAFERYQTAPHRRPLSALSRVELAARLFQLETALDLIVGQAERDMGEHFRCLGSVRAEVIMLRNEIRTQDKQAEAGEPIPMEVLLARVGRNR